MIRLLTYFIILLASVWVGVKLSQDPGYILISFKQWTVESTLWTGLVATVLAFLTLHFGANFVRWLGTLPHRFGAWNARRKIRRAREQTHQGLIEFSEGHWDKAKNDLMKALPHTDKPLLNYLTLARTAQKMGDSKRRDYFLREAQQSMPDAKIAVELTQAELQLAGKQWEQALATLKHLLDLSPKHPYVLKLLMNLYKEVRDWQQLIDLLPKLKKLGIINKHQFNDMHHHATLNKIKDACKSDSTVLEDMMTKLPSDLKDDATINAIYVKQLIGHNKLTEAETVLKRCLKKKYDDTLIALYPTCSSGEKSLAFIEGLTKKNMQSAPLALCLGQICMTLHLWGKARHYLEQSIDIKPSAKAYQCAGRLQEQLNDPSMAMMYYRKGLQEIFQ